MQLSSSCWLWRRSCISRGLPPFVSTGEVSAPPVSAMRPNLPGPMMSRRKGLLVRDELRTKSKADPRESERDALHFSSSSVNEWDDKNGVLSPAKGWRERTYVCACLDVSVQGSLWVERPPAPTPLRCCCRCKTRCVCSPPLSLAADKTWSS